MSLINLITSNAAAALNLIKHWTQQPVLAGVRIEATRFERTIEADVSKHVLVDITQGKKTVNDNVAPGPRTWQIEGYIGGTPLELTSLYMPSLAEQRDLLDAAATAREIVTLMDPEFRTWQVVIASFYHSKEPDTANRVPVRLSVQEVNVLTVGVTVGDPVVDSATPAPGGDSGPPADQGVTENAPQGQKSLIRAGLNAIGINLLPGGVSGGVH